jgi:hypothetical protein
VSWRFFLAAPEAAKRLTSKALLTSGLLSAIAGVFTVGAIGLSVGELAEENPIPFAVEERLQALEASTIRLAEIDQRKYLTAGVIEQERIEGIEIKQSVLEDALENDLERVISVAMIRRDLDEIRNASDRRLSALESRIESLYTLLLWVAGIMVTIVLGALGLVGVLRSSTKTEEG